MSALISSCGYLNICTYVLFIWITLMPDLLQASVIWRCPDFNLLHCKQLPSSCVSFRMIYIRHGDLECPGCLICADPPLVVNLVPWEPPPSVENEVVPNINLKKKKKRRMKEKERRQRERKKMKKQRRREKKEEKRRRKKLKKLERENRNRKSNAILSTNI